MQDQVRTRRNICILVSAFALLLVSGACSKSEPTYDVVTLEGTIEKVRMTSPETGDITLSYYSEKHGQELVDTGLITRETEIMINGALAKISDLREGDRVRGDVRVETKGGVRIKRALKVYVQRADPATGNP